jgi:DNA-binding protein H-NS
MTNYSSTATEEKNICLMSGQDGEGNADYRSFRVSYYKEAGTKGSKSFKFEKGNSNSKKKAMRKAINLRNEKSELGLLSLKNLKVVEKDVESMSKTDSIIAKLVHAYHAKAILKKATIEQLEKIKETIDIVLFDKQEEEKEGMKAQIELDQKMVKAREALIALGLDPDMVLKDDVNIVAKKTKRAMAVDPGKYSITDKNGWNRIWSGMGYPPAQFKQALDAGYKKENMITAVNFKFKKAFDNTEKCTRAELKEVV